MSSILNSLTLGQSSPGKSRAEWQGNAVPSGAMVKKVVPQPFMQALGRSS